VASPSEGGGVHLDLYQCGGNFRLFQKLWASQEGRNFTELREVASLGVSDPVCCTLLSKMCLWEFLIRSAVHC